MTVLGIDLAAEPKKTYACTLDAHDGTLHARIFRDCSDAELVALAEGKVKVGIDAPFGWPKPFVEALVAHQARNRWPAPDDDPEPAEFRRTLTFRTTDLHVMDTRRPLSVSTDKLGVTAMRCAYLLSQWERAGETVDRAGLGRFVEVYPAAALTRWRLDPGGYKGSKGRPALTKIFGSLIDAAPPLAFAADGDLCATNDDAFDALVAALVARAAHLGETEAPAADQIELAHEEGWIHLPALDSLAGLAR